MKKFNKKNYDKAMLAFLSDFFYWHIHQHSILEIFNNYLNFLDEYPVKNFHSRLCCHTSGIPLIISEKLYQDAIFIDKNRNNSFRTNFANTCTYPYTKKKIDYLAKCIAIFLLNSFSKI